MADNIKVLPATGGADPPVATDDIGGIHFQKIKAGWGIDGVFQETADTDGVRLPIGGAQVGTLTETAPGTDTASSGLNGRLQRIAQRLTSLIALLPASLGQKTAANSLAVTVASDQSAVAVSGTVTANAGTNLNTSALLTETADAGRIGIVTETAPGTDTASSGLNGRLQRIAQRLTSLIALVPASLGQKTMAASFAVTVSSDQSSIPVTLIHRETTLTLTVNSGSTISSAVDTAGYANMGLLVPSTFDGSAVTFQVSDTLGGTYLTLVSIGNQTVTMTLTPSFAYDLPGELMAWRFLRIVCGTTQATTSTVFTLVLRS